MTDIVALAQRAAPTVSVAADLAPRLLREHRLHRRLVRRRWGLGVVAVLTAGGVAAATVPGGSSYVRVYSPSGSMEPTLPVGGYSVAARHLAPQRQDVVTFQRDGNQFIKRVVGLQGDTVACPDSGDGRCAALVVNGAPVVEGYPAGAAFDSVTVPVGELFVLGDSRDNSLDSRYFGPVPATDVTGTLVAVEGPGGRHAVPGAPSHPGPDGAVDPAGPVPVSDAHRAPAG